MYITVYVYSKVCGTVHSTILKGTKSSMFIQLGTCDKWGTDNIIRCKILVVQPHNNPPQDTELCPTVQLQARNATEGASEDIVGGLLPQHKD